jgi:hypothetical protein
MTQRLLPNRDITANDLHALLNAAVEAFIQKPDGMILQWRTLVDCICSYGIDYPLVHAAVVDESIRQMMNKAVGRAQRYAAVVSELHSTPSLTYARNLEIEHRSPSFERCIDQFNKILPNR